MSVGLDAQGVVRKPPVPGRVFFGVNLDGTLAHDDGKYRGRFHIGDPNPVVVERVKQRIAAGDVAVVFTSRAADPTRADHDQMLTAVHLWCEQHLGERLHVTAVKQPWLSEIWDHRCVFIPKNAGT